MIRIAYQHALGQLGLLPSSRRTVISGVVKRRHEYHARPEYRGEAAFSPCYPRLTLRRGGKAVLPVATNASECPSDVILIC
jgi:hypothetical protein